MGTWILPGYGQKNAIRCGMKNVPYCEVEKDAERLLNIGLGFGKILFLWGVM